MRVLFVCSRARRRSATAEAIFADAPDIEAMAAGTASDADMPVDADAVQWAETICCMESVHRRRLQDRFGSLLRDKRVVVLNTPDRYEAMAPELIERLRNAMARVLRH